jgi:putative ABC transport system permease protein
MFEIENLKYSLKNLGARKSRSFLTILSIFIGISTIFIFISLGMGLYGYVNDLAAEAGVDKLFVQPKGGGGVPGVDSTFKLTEDDLETVQKTKGIKEAMGYYLVIAEVEKGNQKKYVFGAGYEPTTQNNILLFQSMGINLDKGRELKKGDTEKVTLGYNYQVENKLFEKPVTLGEKILINSKKFEVVGFYESLGNPQDDSNIYMSDEDAKLFSNGEASYAAIFGRVSNIDELDSIADDVTKNLRKAKDQEEGKEEFFVQTFQDAIEQFSAALNIIIGFIILIALISVLVSAVNTANTMITSVLERTKEIGIMKAIGAKRSTIRNIFLFESSFLGFIAGVIGVILGWLFAMITGKILANLGWGFLLPRYNALLFISLIAFATRLGTLSGVIVAIQASKQDPVEALRYE